jgi:hypothetical protein
MSRTTPELESLDQQLRDAFRRADLPAAPGRLRADVEALPSSTRNVAAYVGRARLARWPRSSTLIALLAAAAAIAVIAVGVPILLVQSQGGHASPTASLPAPTDTPSPSLSPQPVVTANDGSSIVADGPSIAWTNVPLSQFGSNTVWAVGAARVGGTMVVAANDSTQNDMKPVIIKSTNGTDWTRVPTGGSEFTNARLDFLVSIPGGLLLVGESLLRDPLCAGGALGCNPVSATLMWVSSDGQNWQPLSAAALAPFDRVFIHSITAGAKGLVAFGTHLPVTGSPDEVVFHSTNGISWSSAVIPDQRGIHGGLVQEVIATASGFVAVGSSDRAPLTSADGGGAAWYSSDGLTWARAATPAGSTDLRYAAAGATGMVATSYALPASSNVQWISADGKTWQTAAISTFTVGSSWLSGDGHEILVISGPSVYWSEDAKTWHRGVSTPTMPSTGIVGTTNLAWIFGSTVVAVSPDDLSLYVGIVGTH